MFEDTEWLIKGRISKKERHYNQKKGTTRKKTTLYRKPKA